MCALFSQFWAFRQKQRGILSEVVRLHEADEIKVRNAKTLRRLEKIPFASWLAWLFVQIACPPNSGMQPWRASQHLWVQLQAHLSVQVWSISVPLFQVFLCPLQNWTVKGPKSAREGRSDIEPVKRPAGVRIKTAQAMLPASLNTRNLCWKKQYI